jgi:hypothetical protein
MYAAASALLDVPGAAVLEASRIASRLPFPASGWTLTVRAHHRVCLPCPQAIDSSGPKEATAAKLRQAALDLQERIKARDGRSIGVKAEEP